MQRQIRVGLVQFREDHTQPPFRKAHLLPIPEEQEEKGDGGEGAETESDQEEAGLLVMPSIIHRQAQVSVRLLRKIFGGKKVFPNPKDHEVLMRLFRYLTGPDDLILDSFAGCGSTAHAVLQLNKDGGANRRFILVELNENVAKDVTATRIERAIGGVADLEPLGGGFRFCMLGEPLFDDAGNIRESVKFCDLAAHVFFTETGSPMPKRANGKSPLLGVHNGTAIYLLFNGVMGDRRTSGGNVLTMETLRKLPEYDGPRVVYGEGSRLSKARLKGQGISFRQIPYEVKVT